MGVQGYIVSGRLDKRPKMANLIPWLDDLQVQFSESEKAVGRLAAGAEVVRSSVANVK